MYTHLGFWAALLSFILGGVFWFVVGILFSFGASLFDKFVKTILPVVKKSWLEANNKLEKDSK